MVAAKEQIQTNPKDAKIIAVTTFLSKLDKTRTSVLEKVQRGRGNKTHTHIKTKGRDPDKSYVGELKNIESQRVN